MKTNKNEKPNLYHTRQNRKRKIRPDEVARAFNKKVEEEMRKAALEEKLRQKSEKSNLEQKLEKLKSPT
jgi:hypothetical protein